MKHLNIRVVLLSLMVALAAASCREDEDPSPVATNPHAQVNSWIKENMDFWYLWSDKMPTSPSMNVEPNVFFKSLLSSDDRFSWIQDNYEELVNSLQGVSKEAGYEYILYKESSSGENVIAQILYVKPGSPAEAAGLKRGDVISHINAKQMTTSNYKDVLAEISENHTIIYKPIDVEQRALGAATTVSLNTVQFSENPNFHHQVIDLAGHKIGYYVYNFFAAGTSATPDAYDNRMDEIFAEFKGQGVTDLVIDLRFNSGGSESSAVALASHIGNGVNSSKIFSTRVYNPKVQDAIIKDKDLGPDFLTTEFVNKTANIGGQLNGNRVYILTSGRTASASELVINGLKPFMDVFLIGDVTYGKNVGSISLFEEDNPKNKWGMQPIVVKVFNSVGQSDYSNGFTPNISDKDNSLYIYPLGDTRETLLGHAIDEILGTSSGGRLGAPKDMLESLGTSIDEKRRSFNLIIDQKVPMELPDAN